jgi:lysozyme
VIVILDMSNWQGVIDWKRIAADGITCVFVKATDGAIYVDHYFDYNRKAAEFHKIRVGAYHFAEPGSPDVQAAHFANVVKTLRRRELRPVLDLESAGLSGHEAEPWARAFNRAIVRRLGVTPLFYSYPDYIRRMQLKRPVGGGLWLASYGRNDGVDHGADVPAPWKRVVAHQFTSVGHYAGVKGKVDVSHAARLTPLLAHPVTGLL